MVTTVDDRTPLLYRNERRESRERKSDSESSEGNNAGETTEAYKSRWRSIRVVYVLVFFNATSLTITLPSLWTYLKVLNPQASSGLLGWAVSAFSLGQIISSPLFGAWANHRRSSKEPMLVCMVLSCLSYVLYMYLDSLPDHKDYYMIAARAIIGFSAGNVGVLRSYISGATTLKDRTPTNANLNICGSVGFVVGPMLQAALVPISYPGPVENPAFHFNMYTAPGLFAALSSFVNIILLLFVFQEHRISDEDKDAETNIQALKDGKTAAMKVDYLAVLSCILLYFVVAFTYQTIQTIGNPLTMHMYGWDKVTATFVQGIVTGGASFLAIVVYLIIKVLSRWISERSLLLTGFLICFSAFFVYLPWGGQLPPRGLAPILDTATNNTTPETVYMMSQVDLSNTDHENTPNFPHIEGHTLETQNHSKRSPETEKHKSVDKTEGHQTSTISLTGTGILLGSHSVTVKNKTVPQSQRGSHQSPMLLHIIDRHLGGNTSNTLNVGQRNVTSPYEEHQEVRHTLTMNGGTPGITEWSTLTTTLPPVPNVTYESLGCPWNYEWCGYVPMVNLVQYICGTILIAIGYPMCHVLVFTIYSKVLGPMPQGLWMGCFAASGSLAGMLGPIYITHIYDAYGPRIAFSGCCGVLVFVILFMLCIFHRLIPFSRRQCTT